MDRLRKGLLAGGVAAILAAVSGLVVEGRQGGCDDWTPTTSGASSPALPDPRRGSGWWPRTTDLPTRFIRIVATDDEGRYVVPDLPDATYELFVRGYGLVDSPRVTATPGRTVDLEGVVGARRQCGRRRLSRRVVAVDARAAARRALAAGAGQPGDRLHELPSDRQPGHPRDSGRHPRRRRLAPRGLGPPRRDGPDGLEHGELVRAAGRPAPHVRRLERAHRGRRGPGPDSAPARRHRAQRRRHPLGLGHADRRPHRQRRLRRPRRHRQRRRARLRRRPAQRHPRRPRPRRAPGVHHRHPVERPRHPGPDPRVAVLGRRPRLGPAVRSPQRGHGRRGAGLADGPRPRPPASSPRSAPTRRTPSPPTIPSPRARGRCSCTTPRPRAFSEIDTCFSADHNQIGEDERIYYGFNGGLGWIDMEIWDETGRCGGGAGLVPRRRRHQPGRHDHAWVDRAGRGQSTPPATTASSSAATRRP